MREDEPTEDGTPLWPARYLTEGRLVVLGAVPRTRRRTPELLRGLLRRWREAELWQQVLLVLLVGPLLAAPFGAVSDDLQGGVGVALWAVGGGAVWWTRRARPDVDGAGQPTPQQVLAAWDTTEARVAGAASRAWLETVREPAWASPFLAGSRAAFDGRAEVARISDLALRINRARARLGARPTGPAAEYWDQQQTALEAAAQELGRRADALIRYRDQAARLSAELQHLDDLERLERSAVEIDDLTVETAYASGRGDGGLSTVAEQVAGVRQGVTELLELMTRTRAPLAEPPAPPPDAS